MKDATFAPAPGALRLSLSAGEPRIELPARPDLTTLLGGRPAQAAADLLPRLYALCGHAHALAAQLAIDAARGAHAVASDTELQTLAAETIKEHVRCIFFDWPLQLDLSIEADATQRQTALIACPLLRKTRDAPAARDWLRAHVFGCDPAQWLMDAEARDWVSAWCRAGATLPARWLGAVMQHAGACARAAAPALPPEPTVELRVALWRSLLGANGHGAQLPPLETGCWVRASRRRRSWDAADRLIARLCDLAALTVGALAPLRALSWSPLPGAALAWVEMARGVLIHAVQLDRSRAAVARYRVMAPTDWNFAPDGPVLRALRDVMGERDAAQRRRRARIIAAAYAPCYPVEVDVAETEPACMN